MAKDHWMGFVGAEMVNKNKESMVNTIFNSIHAIKLHIPVS